MRVLAGDVGGTTTRLAIYERSADGGFRKVRAEHYASAKGAELESLLRRFLGTGPPPERAGFGVAGPVSDGVCRATNLPWVIDAAELERALRFRHVAVVNDFHAVALGVSALGPEDQRVLQDAPTDPDGPVAILGAGTGLGEALIVPDRGGGPPRILATEGGHADFAARNEPELLLLRFLWKRHRRVSVERVVSGPGLHAIYDFIVGSELLPPDPVTLELLAHEDPGKVIGEAALAGSDPAAVWAAALFMAAYGAEAGNLALKTLPTGGLYVAGGIAVRLFPLFAKGHFMSAFRDKGRMSPLLDTIRVSVITHPEVGLLGARTAALSPS